MASKKMSKAAMQKADKKLDKALGDDSPKGKSKKKMPFGMKKKG